MSSAPSKEWIEKEMAGLDNKIKVKEADAAARFEKALGEFNAKFERMMGDSNTKFAQVEANMAKAEAAHTKWMIGIAITLFGTIIASTTFSTNTIKTALPGMIRAEIKGDLDRIDHQFEKVDHQFEKIDYRVEKIEKHMDSIDSQLTDIKDTLKVIANKK
jgi:septal ring factor EnvC (AmiA/AmiB activator)